MFCLFSSLPARILCKKHLKITNMWCNCLFINTSTIGTYMQRPHRPNDSVSIQSSSAGVKFRDFSGFSPDSRTLITCCFVLSAVFPALKMNH